MNARKSKLINKSKWELLDIISRKDCIETKLQKQIKLLKKKNKELENTINTNSSLKANTPFKRVKMFFNNILELLLSVKTF